jgi:hypothetical protein
MILERLGSAFVRTFSSVPVADAASGFRAFSRDVLEAMFLHGRFSYTLETLMLAGIKKFRLVNIPITINPPCRKSRLVKNIPRYIGSSSGAVIRAYLMYHPLRFFAGVGMIFMAGALLLGLRYLFFWAHGYSNGHVQSLILLAVLALMGFQSIVLGLVGEVVAANRRLLEGVRMKLLRNGDSRQ